MSSDKESLDEEDRGKFTHPVKFVTRPVVLHNNLDDGQRNHLVVDSHEEATIVSAESDVSCREEAEGDSSIRKGHSDCQEDIEFNDKTSSETIEDGEEMHKEVQTKEETKENAQVDVLHETGKKKMSKKKERIAKKREKLMQVKIHFKKSLTVLEQKLEKKIPEDEMTRLCDELAEKLGYKTYAEVKEQQGFTPVSRPPFPDEEPDCMKQLRNKGKPVSPPNFRSFNGDRGDVTKEFSLPESPYGWGEVTVSKFIGDDMDKYLDTIGFVKRSVPPDGNSLHRAICEELFLCQRQEDIDLIKKWINWIVELDYKLQRIRKGRDNVKKDGNKDKLRAAAKLFRARISVFEKPNQLPCVYDPPKGITPEIEIVLCEIEPDCFERVTERATAERLGVSQAVAYRAVIAPMYGLDKETIRHCIHRMRVEMGMARDPLTLCPILPPSQLWIPENPSYCSSTPVTFPPPVQYCLIECMDPGIYRNIPCDLYSQEIKQKKTKSEKTSGELPVGSNVMKKDHAMLRQSEIPADCGDRKKLLRNEVRVVRQEPAHTMHNSIAKNRKSPPDPKSLLKHPQTPPLSPLVPHVIPSSTNPPPSPLNYILEPLNWKPFASPPTSPICTGAPSPGMAPVVSMMPCPLQPPSVQMAGQPISVVPAPGTFPSYPFLHSIPPMNQQRRFSVPEQIMANYNRFPLDPSFQTPLSPRYVQTSPIPTPSPSSNHYAIDVSPSRMVLYPPGSSTVPFVYGAHPVPSRTPPICGPPPSSVMYSVPPPPVSPYVNGTMYHQPQATAKEEEGQAENR